jgi:hypothetical protein
MALQASPAFLFFQPETKPRTISKPYAFRLGFGTLLLTGLAAEVPAISAVSLASAVVAAIPSEQLTLKAEHGTVAPTQRSQLITAEDFER